MELHRANWTDYVWIVVVGAMASFFTAYGIGANDVANAFGSSVAARTLTMRQALMIAAVCEFGGAVLLGGEVTRTVSGGIARLQAFEREPEMYMYGMLCALVAAGSWLLLATYLSLPVSTTHSIVGAVLGFAFVYGGPGAVVWLQPQDSFPYVSGLVPIIISWFTSPLLSGLMTSALFVAVRSAILRRQNSLALTLLALPLLVLLTVFINCFLVLYDSPDTALPWGSGHVAWVSAAAAGGCALLTALVGVPLLRRRVHGATEQRRLRQQLGLGSAAPRGGSLATGDGSSGPDSPTEPSSPRGPGPYGPSRTASVTPAASSGAGHPDVRNGAWRAAGASPQLQVAAQRTPRAQDAQQQVPASPAAQQQQQLLTDLQPREGAGRLQPWQQEQQQHWQQQHWQQQQWSTHYQGTQAFNIMQPQLHQGRQEQHGQQAQPPLPGHGVQGGQGLAASAAAPPVVGSGGTPGPGRPGPGPGPLAEAAHATHTPPSTAGGPGPAAAQLVVGPGPVAEAAAGPGHVGLAQQGWARPWPPAHSPMSGPKEPDGASGDADGGSCSIALHQGDSLQPQPHWHRTFNQLKDIVLRGANVDVHAAIETDAATHELHVAAEVFDPSTEHAFKFLQVITACCDSFSHGANDVANSVGPFAAIWYIYRHQRVDTESSLPTWILVLGGAGIVVGLATYGYNIISAIGVRLSVITPARGFCIELSTALVVVLASKWGLPVSTTHCQVGATAAMGLTEGAGGVNAKLFLQFVAGWLVTLLITALLSAALFAAGAYSPSVQQSRAIIKYEDALADLSARLIGLMNRTNHAARADPATWGEFSELLDASLAAELRAVQLAATPGTTRATRPVQTLQPDQVTGFVDQTMQTYVNNSLPYVGGVLARGQALPRRP